MQSINIREPKYRPTFTDSELRLVSACIDKQIMQLVASGQHNNPTLLKCIKLKNYCDSFTAEQDQVSEIINRYKQAQQTANTDSAPTQTPEQQLADQFTGSPIDNPEFTDDQIYDLLSLRDSNYRTEEENKWMLNKGTPIMFQRLSKKPVNPDDL